MPGASGRVAERLSPAQVSRAAELLRTGGIGAFPTETVYGLGADLFQPAAIARVFAVKGRPHFDPLIVHLAGPHWLERVVQSVPPVAQELARRFWPGPLTLILPKREEVTELVTAGLPSVGVRVPDHPLAIELLRQLDSPLVGPSANLFGQISPTTATHVLDQLESTIDFVLDGGPCRVGVESSVVLVGDDSLTLLRPGGVPYEVLRAAVPQSRWLPREEVAGHESGSLGLLSPGTLPRHYAPRTPLDLVAAGEAAPQAQRWRAEHPDHRVGVLTLRGRIDRPGVWVETLSATGDLVEAAGRLFACLRRLDALGLDRLIAERVPTHGLGHAINDRLERAARR